MPLLVGPLTNQSAIVRGGPWDSKDCVLKPITQMNQTEIVSPLPLSHSEYLVWGLYKLIDSLLTQFIKG